MLTRLLFLLGCAAVLSSTALAQESEVILRGNYWRDRNTRVLSPEASLRKTLPTGTTIEAGYLLDAITSASASAGVTSDQPFTELRSEIGARLAQRIGPLTVSALYRYSTESDYWAHTAGGSVAVDLFQKNTSIAVSYYYGHGDVGMRRGALGVIDVGTLQSHFALFSISQVLTRRLLLEGCYEYTHLDGFQSNPYRQVKMSGTPTVEEEPTERQRHALTGGLRWAPIARRNLYLTTYAKYRFYIDDWGVVAHAPELRAYLGLGPTELRLTGRYYRQSAADFYQENSAGIAEYAAMGVMRPHCPTNTGCFTGDAKLSRFNSYFLEGRFQVALRFLDRPKMPLGHWLGGSLVNVSFGYYWNDGFAYKQFGNAYVGGLEFVFPL